MHRTLVVHFCGIAKHCKVHSHAFSHLREGKTVIRGATRVAWTSQQHLANTRSRWSHIICREKDSLARDHQSLEFSVFRPNEIFLVMKALAHCNIRSLHKLTLFSVRSQRRRRGSFCSESPAQQPTQQPCQARSPPHGLPTG